MNTEGRTAVPIGRTAVLNTQFRIGATALALVGVACTASSSDTRVARAHTLEFTAEDAVLLIGPQSELPADPSVVQTVADLWVDYTLLAHAWTVDSTYGHLDLDFLVDQQVEQELILTLRDRVVQPDTAITEADLRALYEAEAPGVRARASHILLGVPEQATQAERDSVQAEAEALRGRIDRGEDFGALARAFSQDRGSGQRDGDLGFFDRGQMVRPFDEAVFALEVGEVSDVVQTPYGFHIIRLDELQTPTFEDSRVEFRDRLVQTRTLEAESVYVSGVFDAAEPEVREGAADLVREIARDPRVTLSRRAQNRVLMDYRGGEVTVGDLRDFMEGRDAQYRVQVLNAPDEVIERDVLDAILQRELLVAAARAEGIEPSAAQRDSLAEVARGRFRGAAGSLGLIDDLRASPDRGEAAVDDAVDRLMARVVSGETNVIPLGAVALALRKAYRAELFEAGIFATVNRLREIRGPEQLPANPGTLPTQAPTAPADSMGQ